MTAGEEDDTIADKVTRAPAGRHPLPIALTDEGGDITYTQPLSWRDVGRMVAESEARIQQTLGGMERAITKVLDSHEERLHDVEEVQVGARASINTAAQFFKFGRWVLATVISACGVIIMAIAAHIFH